MFPYRAFAAAVIIDVRTQKHLNAIKKELLSLTSKLESATEDKIYVYTKGNGDLPKRIGESVAAISNYNITQINMEFAIKQSIYALNDASYSSQKYILVFSDSFVEHDVSRAARAMVLGNQTELDVSYHFMIFGEKRSEIAKNLGESNDLKVHDVTDLNAIKDILEGLINDRNEECEETPDQGSEESELDTTNNAFEG